MAHGMDWPPLLHDRGYFSKKIPPKLTIKSGDIVTVEMVSVSAA